jgi:hypothetical protein
VGDFGERVESAVVFFDRVAIGQSPPDAPNGSHNRHADQDDQEHCAHQGDPLMASRWMSEQTGRLQFTMESPECDPRSGQFYPPLVVLVGAWHKPSDEVESM